MGHYLWQQRPMTVSRPAQANQIPPLANPLALPLETASLKVIGSLLVSITDSLLNMPTRYKPRGPWTKPTVWSESLIMSIKQLQNDTKQYQREAKQLQKHTQLLQRDAKQLQKTHNDYKEAKQLQKDAKQLQKDTKRQNIYKKTQITTKRHETNRKRYICSHFVSLWVWKMWVYTFLLI